MADFTKAYWETAKAEGGFTRNTSDRGNFVNGKLIGTNKGISAPVLAAWLGRVPTMEEMKALKTEVAQAIYKKEYWDKIKGDQINDQAIANKVYDMAVNAGVGTSLKLWQMSIGVPQTGKMDLITLNKTNVK